MKNIILAGLFFAFLSLQAQEQTTYLKVRKINFSNNKKTRPYVMLREMSFNEGDSIPGDKLDSILLANRLQIFNLGIFNDIQVNIKNWEEDSLDLIIKVYEKFPLSPGIILQFADRNAAEWWRKYNHDFKRLQYGLILNYNNVSGRNDKLIGAISFGFAKRLDLGYIIPAFDSKKDNVGMALFFNFLHSKRIAYNTLDNELKYMDITAKAQLIKTEFTASINYRRELHNTHYFSVGYGFSKVSDYVLLANPEYFLDGVRKQNYLKLGYVFESDHRNLKAYPTNGWYIRMNFTNYGLGFMKTRMTTAGFMMSRYYEWKKHKKFSLGFSGRFQVSWPFKQPYNLQPIKSFGYNDNLIRGYEVNVMDGQHFLLFKNEYRYRLFSFQLKNLKKIKNKNNKFLNSSLAFLPFNMYLTAYFDAGYVWDNAHYAQNSYRNKWQFGYGVGLNLVTFNQRLFRIEYSINRYLDKGVYLHFELPF